MSTRVPVEKYSPPKNRDSDRFPVDLGGGHGLEIRLDLYRGLAVDFSIQQNYSGFEWPMEVFRIDCDHGEVHSHQFFQNGAPEVRRVIQVIPAGEGSWDCVDRNYTDCLDSTTRDYLDHYRRWRV